jgi:excisionase family DNA binding protein
MVDCNDKNGLQPPRLTVVSAGDDAPQPKNHDGLWLLKDVCEYLKMGPTWVRARTASGEMPCIRLGRAVRYSPTAIREWAEQQGAR